MEYKNFNSHIKAIARWFGFNMCLKYRKGQKEHGGNLWRKSVLYEITNELLDLIVYYHVLLNQLEDIKDIAKEAYASLKDGEELFDMSYRRKVALEKIYNILEVGNEEGIAEKGT